jgi:hypothetical protein
MLTHIVVWKYREGVTAAEREDHVARLRRLPSFISHVESFIVGADELRLARSYDTGLVATFRDRAGLEAYDAHPEHVLVAAFGRSISAHVASVDFESEG